VKESSVEDTEPEEANRLLQEVCHQVTSMLDKVQARPRRLSVTAGPVAVEFEWPDSAGPAVQEEARQSTQRGDDEDIFYVRAPTVGAFYRAPEPGAKPFAVEGERVLARQQLGILEAMKMMLPVEAHRSGLLVAFLADDGEPVEFDAPLAALRPDDTALG
jgi:acetyl-CoA carboxylase biotin carboxyl carrier protein